MFKIFLLFTILISIALTIINPKILVAYLNLLNNENILYLELIFFGVFVFIYFG